jgi:hypothetical protein
VSPIKKIYTQERGVKSICGRNIKINVDDINLGSEQNWSKYWTSRIMPNDPIFDLPPEKIYV